jgi:hypothetical protein
VCTSQDSQSGKGKEIAGTALKRGKQIVSLPPTRKSTRCKNTSLESIEQLPKSAAKPQASCATLRTLAAIEEESIVQCSRKSPPELRASRKLPPELRASGDDLVAAAAKFLMYHLHYEKEQVLSMTIGKSKLFTGRMVQEVWTL